MLQDDVFFCVCFVCGPKKKNMELYVVFVNFNLHCGGLGAGSL